jgi:tetratricopeptide (TPR) repeat protein
MRRHLWLVILSVLGSLLAFTAAQTTPDTSVLVQQQSIRAEPPSPTASAAELEARGDELRLQKQFLDALDYLRAAIAKEPTAVRYNKAGITQLQMQRFKEAKKDFDRAIKLDRNYAEPYNNIGVIDYAHKKYGRAIKQYKKALALKETSAAFHGNLGTAYFSDKRFEEAVAEYNRAVELDPEIFEHSSHGGVAAHLSSPEDRAHYSYLIAKMYARIGMPDRALLYLRRAMEDGYKDIQDVYKDAEFATLRKDPRFTELMAAKPPALPQ